MNGPWTRDEFYRQRDLRSNAVLGRDVNAEQPIHVVVDSAACQSTTGQVLVLALVNQLARVHRTISLDLAVPDQPLLSRTIFEGRTVGEVALGGARQIDPFGSFALSTRPPARALTIGIGSTVSHGLDWYVGAERSVASLDTVPQGLDVLEPGSVHGAALASCLGSAAIFRTVHGLSMLPRTLSVWNYAEGKARELGPAGINPLDVGRVLIVGAGAVASGLVYWLHVFGVRGSWSVVDGDIVQLHNTNRSLLFLPVDAGWGGREPAHKARIVAQYLPGCEWDSAWYHESHLARREVDVILALANDFDVRTRIASLSPPIVLHATTGENWISQLHRHIAGRDDCIRCRTADVKVPRFRCSEGILPATEPGEEQGDAALPFLSAASGLMLATALQRLEAGVLHTSSENDWRWYWDSAHVMARDGIRSCRADCHQLQPLDVRLAMHAGTRWIGLDSDLKPSSFTPNG
jgi:hypothetical protein